jgi:hypothetical protein
MSVDGSVEELKSEVARVRPWLYGALVESAPVSPMVLVLALKEAYEALLVTIVQDGRANPELLPATLELIDDLHADSRRKLLAAARVR